MITYSMELAALDPEDFEPGRTRYSVSERVVNYYYR